MLVLELEVPPYGRREVPVDLTRPHEGEMEIVIERVAPVGVELLVLGGPAGIDVAELRRHWADQDDPDNLLWLRETLLPATPLLRAPVEIEVLGSDDRVLATASLTPDASGEYEVETRWQALGGVSHASGGQAPLPVADLSLPPEPVRIVAKADGFRDAELALDLTGTAGGRRSAAIVLVR